MKVLMLILGLVMTGSVFALEGLTFENVPTISKSIEVEVSLDEMMAPASRKEFAKRINHVEGQLISDLKEYIENNLSRKSLKASCDNRPANRYDSINSGIVVTCKVQFI